MDITFTTGCLYISNDKDSYEHLYNRIVIIDLECTWNVCYGHEVIDRSSFITWVVREVIITNNPVQTTPYIYMNIQSII